MMQPVPPARPGRRLAGGDVLPGHPPARDFLRLPRIAHIVDHENVADIALHLGRDVGVTLVHVEAVHADPAGLLIRDQLRLRGVGDVVDFESAVGIAAPLEHFQHRQVILAHGHLGGDFLARRLAA